jgi:hypothetical protein
MNTTTQFNRYRSTRQYINFYRLIKRLKRADLIRGYHTRISRVSSQIERVYTRRHQIRFTTRAHMDAERQPNVTYNQTSFNVNKVLDVYSDRTKPVLAYRMVKKKSFKKKRKIYLVRYNIFINNHHNKNRFLYTKIKHLYFGRFKGKKVNNDVVSYRNLLLCEILRQKHSYLYQQKISFYRDRGRLAITDLVKIL